MGCEGEFIGEKGLVGEDEGIVGEWWCAESA